MSRQRSLNPNHSAIKSPVAELIEAITDLSYKVERSTARDGQGLDGRRTIVQLSLAHAKSILSAVAPRPMCTRCGLRPRWHRAWDVNGETRCEETPYCSVCWGDPKASLSERVSDEQVQRAMDAHPCEAHQIAGLTSGAQALAMVTCPKCWRIALAAAAGASPVLAAQGAEPPPEGK